MMLEGYGDLCGLGKVHTLISMFVCLQIYRLAIVHSIIKMSFKNVCVERCIYWYVWYDLLARLSERHYKSMFNTLT